MWRDVSYLRGYETVPTGAADKRECAESRLGWSVDSMPR
jgi:hypothetical protein